MSNPSHSTNKRIQHDNRPGINEPSKALFRVLLCDGNWDFGLLSTVAVSAQDPGF